jgi:hypothetical protein
MKPCARCQRPTEEMPDAPWVDVLCDDCFQICDEQFRPIAEWLNRSDVQEAITEEDAETERQLSAGLDTITTNK